MSSKNATVALMSVTRIIVCRYSMGSSPGLLRRWLRSITPPLSRGSPSTHGRLGLGTKPRHPGDDHSALKQRAAAASIAASSILAAVKLIAGLASGSLALLSEGAHNIIDVGASALTFFAVREADKPADSDHPFGHAKIEAVAALAETGFLAVLSIGVAIAAVMRIRAAGRRGRGRCFRHRRDRALDRRRRRALAGADPCGALDLEPCAQRRRAALFERPRRIRACPHRPRRRRAPDIPMPTRSPPSGSPCSSPRQAIALAERRSTRSSTARPRG